ncbi:MAG: hypothetical protein CSA68_02550 [Rhodobacterales bacterium]|nr:MAG: hypothetical protein CSA68_02550 [Rhodobacterales bacterium]
MTQQSELSTLQRKAGVGRDPLGGVGMTPLKALRLAMARAAQAQFSLALRATNLTQDRLRQADLLAQIEPDALLVLLDGPPGAHGFVAVDLQTLASVIEVQTMGRVSATPAQERQPTRTDAAMVKPLIDGVVQGLVKYLKGSPDESWATGYEFGGWVENARLLGLRLKDVQYRLFCADLELADGAKRGKLMMGLPAVGLRAVPDAEGGGQNWSKELRETLQASRIELDAVLYRTQMALKQVLALKPGDLVPVPVTTIGDVVIEGVDGRIIGHARLGQQHGYRALRISGLPDGAPQQAPPMPPEPHMTEQPISTDDSPELVASDAANEAEQLRLQEGVADHPVNPLSE